MMHFYFGNNLTLKKYYKWFIRQQVCWTRETLQTTLTAVVFSPFWNILMNKIRRNAVYTLYKAFLYLKTFLLGYTIQWLLNKFFTTERQFLLQCKTVCCLEYVLLGYRFLIWWGRLCTFHGLWAILGLCKLQQECKVILVYRYVNQSCLVGVPLTSCFHCGRSQVCLCLHIQYS